MADRATATAARASRPPATARRLIVGLGNPLCGDDGAGHAVIRHLRERQLAEVELLALDGEATQLITAWTDADWVAVVDASRSGAAPAAVLRFDAIAGNLPARFERASTHGFGLAEAVALARNLDRLPARLLVYTIEGQRFQPGTGLSAKVAGAASSVAAELAERATASG